MKDKDFVGELLGELCRKSHQAKGTDSYYPLVAQARKELVRWIKSHIKIRQGKWTEYNSAIFDLTAEIEVEE